MLLITYHPENVDYPLILDAVDKMLIYSTPTIDLVPWKRSFLGVQTTLILSTI